MEKRIDILRNVWDEKIINDRMFEVFLESRLIPLNKKFPNCPKVQDISPIVVTSQLIKLQK